jgi:2-polyprenyl-3-methyl-5-hydroxy-6-metoxy-1,4-benzoquinol methylase
MATADRFWDNRADRYAAQPIADEDAYQTKLRLTRGYLRPDMELFEFGCGTGSTAIVHAPHVAHIRAIDFSARMLEIAEAKARAAGVSNISFERAEITSLPEAAGRYDMILGLSILHLLEEVDLVIGKVRRMLRPGGLFVSSTACLGDTMPIFKYAGPLGRALGLLPPLTVMTSDELVGKLERAGFRIAHRWLPGRGKALFVIAEKPGAA